LSGSETVHSTPFTAFKKTYTTGQKFYKTYSFNDFSLFNFIIALDGFVRREDIPQINY
jgi:hypothetical protein